MNNGLFGSQQTEPLYSCPSGNCTFAEKYSSIAYCSSCIDATAALEIELFQQYDETGKVLLNKTRVSLSVGSPNITLSRGSNLYGGSLGLVAEGASQISIIRWDGRSDIPGPNETIRGYRCKLFPCLKTFTAQVYNGRLRETLVEENHGPFSTVNAREMMISMADLNCLESTEQRDILKRLGYQFNAATRWLPYNVTLSRNSTEENPEFLDSGPAVYALENPCNKAPARNDFELCNGNRTTKEALEVVPPRCIYNMEVPTILSLEKHLFGQLFTGEVRNDASYGYPGFMGNETLRAVFNAGSANGSLEDLQSIMRNVTSALTTHIRQTGAKGLSEPALGLMFQYTTCVRVRWAWLAYVAVIVGLTLVFFTCMVVFARRAQATTKSQWVDGVPTSTYQDFKSSILPILFHGFDDESLRKLNRVSSSRSEKDLKEKAGETWVTVVATEQGSKIVAVSS